MNQEHAIAMRSEASTTASPAAHSEAHVPHGIAFLLVGVAVAGLGYVGLTVADAVRWQGPPPGVTLATVAVASLALGAGLALLATRRNARGGQDADLAALAHDLRAPLSTARTLLDLLDGAAFGELPRDAKDAAARAAGATARAQALLEGVLRQHAAGAAAAPPRDAVPLDAVMDRVEQSLASRIEASAARIQRGALPAVRADAIAVERALTNLVQNALEHPLAGTPPLIEVSARVEGSMCEIAVRDYGTGIPADQHERVFEPGVRGFSPSGAPGFGLGLATVRRMAERHGGRAWIDSDVRDGACIRLTLPAA